MFLLLHTLCLLLIATDDSVAFFIIVVSMLSNHEFRLLRMTMRLHFQSFMIVICTVTSV